MNIPIVAKGIKGIEYSGMRTKIFPDYGVTVFERLRSSMYSKRISPRDRRRDPRIPAALQQHGSLSDESPENYPKIAESV